MGFEFRRKVSVLFDEFNRSFGGLWQGRVLRLTLAARSGFVSLVLFLMGYWLPPD